MCVYACMCVRGCSACVLHCVMWACQRSCSVPAEWNRSLSKLRKRIIMFQDYTTVKVMRETYCVNFNVWMNSRLGGQQGVTLKGTETKGPSSYLFKQRGWSQDLCARTLIAALSVQTVKWNALRARKGFLCGQYMTDGIWFSWAITSVVVGVESGRH